MFFIFGFCCFLYILCLRILQIQTFWELSFKQVMYLKRKLKSFRNWFTSKKIRFVGENNDKMRIFQFFAKKLGRLDVFDGRFLKILNNKSKNWLCRYLKGQLITQFPFFFYTKPYSDRTDDYITNRFQPFCKNTILLLEIIFNKKNLNDELYLLT